MFSVGLQSPFRWNFSSTRRYKIHDEIILKQTGKQITRKSLFAIKGVCIICHNLHKHNHSCSAVAKINVPTVNMIWMLEAYRALRISSFQKLLTFPLASIFTLRVQSFRISQSNAKNGTYSNSNNKDTLFNMMYGGEPMFFAEKGRHRKSLQFYKDYF